MVVRSILATVLASSLLLVSVGVKDYENAYKWDSVDIGGGGYITGLTTHPHSAELLYARTDVGGANRWEAADSRWVPILDSFTVKSYYSVDALAIDPNDTAAKKVYAAVGRRAAELSDIIRSGDRGKPGTWTETGLPSSVEIFGNGDFRWAGDRLVMDPNRPGRYFFGSRQDGLWVNGDIDSSTKADSKWSQIPVSQLPAGSGIGKLRDGSSTVGVTFIAFDSSGGADSDGNTRNMLVGVFGSGVYRSADAGRTFAPLNGSPSYPVQGRTDNKGALYVTYVDSKDAANNYNGGGVMKWNGATWANITPGGVSKPYAALDIDPNNDSRIAVSVRIGNSPPNPVYLSADGGASWSASLTPKSGSPNFPVSSVSWWPATFFSNAVSAVRFAPSKAYPNRLWLSDWFGTWQTNDIAASPASIQWNNYEEGHEEVVVFDIKSPPANGTGAAKLFTGLADVTGFRHTDINKFPAAADRLTVQGVSGGIEMTSFDVFEGDNNIVYRVYYNENAPAGNGYKSVDNGVTRAAAFDPAADPVLPDTLQGGKIAVSAGSADLIVWLPIHSTPYMSTDGGVNWTASTGVSSSNLVVDQYDTNPSLAVNRTGANRFYVYHPRIGFFVSNTGASAGTSFTQMTGNGLPAAAKADRYAVKAVPGQDGGVWTALGGSGSAGSDGLYASANYGETFVKLANVQRADHLAFGKVALGSAHPAAVYMYGRANGDSEHWLYRSDDMGATWKIINDAAHRFGSGVRVLEADRQVYGQVYVGPSGRGIQYGRPSQPD